MVEFIVLPCVQLRVYKSAYNYHNLGIRGISENDAIAPVSIPLEFTQLRFESTKFIKPLNCMYLFIVLSGITNILLPSSPNKAIITEFVAAMPKSVKSNHVSYSLK